MSLCGEASAPASTSGDEVERRAGDRGGLDGFVVLEQQAGAEVHQHEAAALFADDVLRLDVAMDEAGGVDRGQRPAQVLAEQRRLAAAERALPLQQLLEGVAADELHPQPDAAVVGVDAVHGDDVAVADAGQEAAFVQHLGGEQLRGSPARPQELHGDVAAQRFVEGAVDLAVDAGADALLQQEAAPADAGGRRIADLGRRRRRARAQRPRPPPGGCGRRRGRGHRGWRRRLPAAPRRRRCCDGRRRSRR